MESSDFIAIIALCFTVYFAWQQAKQTKSISDGQAKQTKSISEEQIKLAQRQAYIAIHDKVNALTFLSYDSQKIWEHITNNVNILELLAIAMEYDLVDRSIIERLHKKSFMDVYEQIRGYTKNVHPDLEIDAITFLSRYAPTASKVYADWKR